MCTRSPILIARVLALLAVILVVGSSQAGEAKDPVELLPHWKEGEKRRFEVVKSLTQSKNGQVTQKSQTRTGLEVEVVKAARKGYVVRWTFGETTFDPKVAKNPVLQRMSNLLKGFQILLDVDRQGTITGVQNWKELKESSDRLLDAMTAELEKAGIDKAMAAQVRAQAALQLSTKEQIEQMCTKEAQLFVAALGRAYTVGKAFEYEDKLANPVGGDPLPARGTFTLTSLDAKAGSAVLSWKQTVDARQARRIMEATIRTLAEKLGKQPPGADLLKDLSIEDTGEFSIEAATGWTERVTYTRTARTGQLTREDTTTITRKRE